MEAGQAKKDHQSVDYRPTASFYTGAQKMPSDNRKTSQNETERRRCVFCDQGHHGECQNVSDIKQRIATVRTKRLCFNCLSKSHIVSKCSSKFRCRQCKGKHHTSICDSFQLTQRPSHSNQSDDRACTTGNNVHTRRNSEDGAAILHAASKTSCSDVLLKTAISPVCADGRYAEANILMDEGAQRSFITQKLADRLQLVRDGTDVIQLSSFGDPSHRVQHLDTATVNVVAVNGDLIPIRVLIVPVIAKPISNRYRRSVQNLPYLRGLTLAHPVTMYDTFDISLLIGVDFYWEIVEDKTVRGDGPTAVSSRIGYFLSGPLTPSSGNSSHVMDILTMHLSDTTDLTRFWELESMGISSEDNEDTDGSMYLKHYQDRSISFLDGRYTAKLPWKQDHQPLPSNYKITKKRTESTIRRLSKEPHLLQKYDEIIKEQENRGFIERVDENTPASRVHYIPHHVVKKDSATTPIRIVYDCSCRQSTGSPSLNDCLESTPPELIDLTTLLMRFRQGQYAVSADIEKAFLNVALHEDDRDVTRFLWLSDPADPDSELVVYRFRSVLFGATCSPFILSATLLKHLTLNACNPAADIIARDLYVDNVISSITSKDEVLSYFRHSRDLMADAGFNLRSWTSNCKELRNIAEAEDVLESDDVAKVLGMMWDPEVDQMSFVMRKISPPEESTKRSILKQTSRIYDPLGLLSPVTVRAKLLVQGLWKNRFDWDTPLPADITNTWTDIASDLNSAMSYTFPRRYFQDTETTSQSGDITLYVFVDASARAYGAVAYITSGNGAHITFAKNRVAPVKEISLPRLELMAALIGARVAQHVTTAVSCKKIVCWSDSQIVLHWLKSTKTLKRFVSNRVQEIKKLLPVAEWRYCPTEENPADLLTRGITALLLHSSTLWRNGPSWLDDMTQWPVWEPTVTSAFTTVAKEESAQASTSGGEPPRGVHLVIDINRYSCYRKLLRVTTYVMRFIANCKNTTSQRHGGPLTTYEMRQFELKLIKNSQRQSYHDVIQDITSKRRHHPIVRQLRLYLDENGCIRCGGRIHNAQLPETAKFPYLLPPKTHLTKLMIIDAHYNQLHANC